MEKELNQEGDAKEQPIEENLEDASKAPSPEEKETSEKQDEWKRTMQSRADKAEFTLKSTQTELQKLQRRDYERQLADRKREVESLEGEPDEQAKARHKHQLQDEIKTLEENNERLKGAVMDKYDQAKILVREHNLNPDDIFKLIEETTTATEMKLMAENLGLKTKEQTKVQGAPPKEKEGFPKPDSGTSDAGGDSDEAFMKNYSEGKSDDHARAKKLLTKIK